MNKSKLLYSALLGILGATLAFVVFSMSQLQSDLDAVSRQLVNTNKAFAQATAKSKPSLLKASTNNGDDLDAMKSIFGDLADQIEAIDNRLNDLDTNLADVQELLAANETEEQPVKENYVDGMAHTTSAYTSEQAPISPAETTALLEYALNDPITEDQIWADNTAVQVEEIFATSPSLKIATSYNVTCGGQLCKIKSMLPKDISFIEKEFFDMNLMADLSPMMERSILQANILPDGTTEYTHYVARKGHYLPTEGGGQIGPESDDDS